MYTQGDTRNRTNMQARMDYIRRLQLPCGYMDEPAQGFCTKFIISKNNKDKTPVNALTWAPDGRRLISGCHSGEFALWKDLTFNFENLLQAHDDAVRSMIWSHSDEWMVTADEGGVIKYWQSSMNNVKAFRGHKESIRDLSFCPTDAKFASCSDDQTVSIWDFERCIEEFSLRGHGWDVKTVAWHPSSALLASGSKDNLIMMWDPRTGERLATVHGHKNTVSKLRWNQNGNWFVTASRDQLLKVWDIRTMREICSLKGHAREVRACRCLSFVFVFLSSFVVQFHFRCCQRV